jgi:hypothetical protein
MASVVSASAATAAASGRSAVIQLRMTRLTISERVR